MKEHNCAWLAGCIGVMSRDVQAICTLLEMYATIDTYYHRYILECTLRAYDVLELSTSPTHFVTGLLYLQILDSIRRHMPNTDNENSRQLTQNFIKDISDCLVDNYSTVDSLQLEDTGDINLEL